MKYKTISIADATGQIDSALARHHAAPGVVRSAKAGMANMPASNTPLRVVFCTTPSIYSDLVLQELIQSSRIELVGVVASSRILRKEGWAVLDALQLVLKTGLRYAAYLWLVTSGYTFLSRLRPNFVRTYLKHHAVPFNTTRDINQPESLAFIRSCSPDFMLSAHFNQLIGPELLGLPQLGCLNIHPGKLPEYRGVDPAFYALLRSEVIAGVTLHYQDEQFDTGAVIASADQPVLPAESLVSLNCRLFTAGARLLCAALEQDHLNQHSGLQEGTARYDTWPEGHAVTLLRKTGHKLVDFSLLLKKLA